MIDSAGLEAIFNRLEAGKRLSKQDLQTLVTAVRSQQILLATGDRAVAIGGSADGAVIVTGDRNIVITEGNAEALREFIGIRPRNEQLLLNVVKEEVTARLKQSLHKQVLIQLGLELQPEQVKRAWDSDIKIGDKPAEPIPENWEILQVFDEVQGKLLILGNPGAGKTTTCLELAQALCNRANQQEDCPIPVLFNLSSWQDSQHSLQAWIVEELRSKYRVRADVAQKWLQDRRLLLMLDGLDELHSEQQNPCMQAINELLIQENTPLSLVVCSRYEEYQILKSAYHSQLQLNGAIVLKALTDNQVQSYLYEIERSDLWKAISQDAALLEIVRIPLLLSITVLAYQVGSLEQWKVLTSTQSRLQYLINHFIHRMIGREIRYKSSFLRKIPSSRQSLHYLHWLAQMLESQSTTEFLVEYMQPSCLKNRNQKRLYQIVIMIIASLQMGILIWLILTLIFGSNFEAIRITSTVIAGILHGFLFITFKPEIQPLETFYWSWQEAQKTFIFGLRGGWGMVPFLSFIFAIAAGIFLGLQTGILGFILGLVSGIVLGLISGIVLGLIMGTTLGFSAGLTGLYIGERKSPNQGIWWSLKNTLILSSIYGLSSSLIATLLMVIFPQIAFQPMNVFLALMIGILFGISDRSGRACAQHFTLRLILYYNNQIPWNYARFLDYATDRLLLQRVGGRYRFIHRLLQEHFATMPLEK